MTELPSYLTKIMGHKLFNLLFVVDESCFSSQEYIIRIQRGVSADNSWQVNRASFHSNHVQHIFR